MARKALGPATLQVMQAVRAAVPGDRALLVAVSGGADSLALAIAVRQVAIEYELPYAAITVDHGLQSGSAQQAQTAAAQLRDLGYADVVSHTVDVPEHAGPEADARAARYAVLDREAADRDSDLVLGHSLDDQAETVLLGLTRGSGGRSLAGMSDRSGRRLRPLLAVRRETMRAACRECQVAIWDDPFNAETRFTRVRIRQSVLPVLESELGPGIAAALARTADLLRDDTDLLDRLASDLLSVARHGDDLDCSALAESEPALRGRAVKSWLTESGATEASYEQVRAVERLITNWRGQGPVQLPGLVVTRRAGRLSSARAQDAPARDA